MILSSRFLALTAVSLYWFYSKLTIMSEPFTDKIEEKIVIDDTSFIIERTKNGELIANTTEYVRKYRDDPEKMLYLEKHIMPKLEEIIAEL